MINKGGVHPLSHRVKSHLPSPVTKSTRVLMDSRALHEECSLIRRNSISAPHCCAAMSPKQVNNVNGANKNDSISCTTWPRRCRDTVLEIKFSCWQRLPGGMLAKPEHAPCLRAKFTMSRDAQSALAPLIDVLSEQLSADALTFKEKKNVSF